MNRFTALASSYVVVIGVVLGCSSMVEKLVKEPKVTLAGVDMKNLNQDGGTILVKLQVDNPNSYGLKIDSLKYDLEVGGKHLSSGQLEAPAEVEGLKSTIVPIPVPVKFSQLFSSAMDFIQKRTTQYRVKGEAKFGLITIPFDNAGDLKLNE